MTQLDHSTSLQQMYMLRYIYTTVHPGSLQQLYGAL